MIIEFRQSVDQMGWIIGSQPKFMQRTLISLSLDLMILTIYRQWEHNAFKALISTVLLKPNSVPISSKFNKMATLMVQHGYQFLAQFLSISGFLCDFESKAYNTILGNYLTCFQSPISCNLIEFYSCPKSNLNKI